MVLALRIWRSMSAMLHQILNDFILSAMLLRWWCRGSVTLATMELSNVFLAPLVGCRLDDITMTSV